MACVLAAAALLRSVTTRNCSSASTLCLDHRNPQTSRHTDLRLSRFLFRVERRNPTLLARAFRLCHCQRRTTRVHRRNLLAASHTISINNFDSKTLLRVDYRAPPGRLAMSVCCRYLKPRIYDKTIIDDYLISTLHHTNRRSIATALLHARWHCAHHLHATAQEHPAVGGEALWITIPEES